MMLNTMAVPREFSSIDHCFTGIPLQVRRGLSLVDIQFTCIDAVEQFVAVGTNIGVVYWCNRRTSKVDRLRPEKSGGPVTCVKIVSSVDYMLAFGDSKGVVSIFIIPKKKPLFLPKDQSSTAKNIVDNPFFSLADQSSALKNSVERFTAIGIHASSITAVEWSLNGQKLFTGDEKGIICFTQMDFRLNIIKSAEILNEKFPIVQLSYSQPNLLLIASEYRCVIYNQSAENQVHQVGQKERSNACKLGAVIGSHSSLQGPIIYSARPKQRLWLADVKGQVCKTLLFKEALTREYPKIELSRFENQKQVSFLAPSECSSSAHHMLSNVEFCCLKVYLGKLLLVHDTKNLLLLNPETASIIGGQYLKKIVSVTTYKDEILILEGYRRIRRLALSEDPSITSKMNYLKDSVDSPIELLRGIVTKIKVEASQNVVKPFLENLKKMEENILEDDISPAEEAINLNLRTEQRNVPSSSFYENNESLISVEKKSSPGKDSVHNSKNPSRSSIQDSDKQSSSVGDTSNQSSTGCDTEQQSNAVPKGADQSENSSVVDHSSVSTEKEVYCEQKVTKNHPTSLHISLEDIPRDIVPDMRTPDSLLRALEDKEQKLALLLNLNVNDEPTVTKIVCQPQNIKLSPEPDGTSPVFENVASEEVFEETELPDANESSVVEERTIEDKKSPAVEKSNENIVSSDFDMDKAQNCCECSWRQLNLPFSAKWICITNSKIYIGEAKLTVYACDSRNRKFQWTKQKFRALRLAVSPNENIFWRLDPNIAYAYLHDSDRWKVIAREVNCIAVNDRTAWYISKGQIFVHLSLSREKPFSDESIKLECPVNVSKVRVFQKAVWILSDKGQIFSRNEITDNNPVGSSWRKLAHPENVFISDIALACRNSGWIIDKRNDIYFTNNFDEENITWWQVIVGQHVYGNDSSLSDQLSKFVSWSKESSSTALVGSDESSLWIVNAGENSVYINKTAIIGHRWIPFGAGNYFKTKWKFISACGVDDKTSVLWCVNTNNDIFLYRKSTEVFRPIEAPTTREIVCVSSVGNSFWVLTEDGQVLSRSGISDSNPFGCFWEELNISPDPANSLTFKLLSCSADIIWGIGSNNEIYAAAVGPSTIADDAGTPDWKLVEDLTPRDSKIIDIVVGCNKCMVWAIDVKYNVYVRQAVFEDFPFGTEWIIVPGIKAVNLTISCFAVWALGADGNIYRRFGISPTNFIGDYWMQVPGLLSLICASPSEDLWGLSKINGRLQRYERHILGISEDYVDQRRFSENLEDDWEIIT